MPITNELAFIVTQVDNTGNPRKLWKAYGISSLSEEVIKNLSHHSVKVSSNSLIFLDEEEAWQFAVELVETSNYLAGTLSVVPIEVRSIDLEEVDCDFDRKVYQQRLKSIQDKFQAQALSA